MSAHKILNAEQPKKNEYVLINYKDENSRMLKINNQNVNM